MLQKIRNSNLAAKRSITALVAIAFVSVSVTSPAYAATLTASGSSFAYKYILACKDSTGHTITYSSTGSGTGRTQFNDGTTDFGASDAASALSKTGKYQYIPMTGGPITITYNVPELKGKTLKLDGPTLAKIFRGVVTVWNDAKIKDLNPGLMLPNKTITVVYRNGSSGTTENFTDYMNQVAATDWPNAKNSTFQNGAPSIPRGGKGAANSQVMITTLKNTKYAIGYVDLSDAITSGLSFAAVKNGAGDFVAPTANSSSLFLNSFSTADPLTGVKLDFTKSIAGAYNLSLITYAIAPLAGGNKSGTDIAAVKAAVGYLVSTCDKGPGLGYVKLSGALATAANDLVSKIA